MTEQPLKPCPLCGGRAEDHPGSSIVYCENSACGIHAYPLERSIWNALSSRSEAEALDLRRKLYDAHAALWADGGISESDCSCEDCIAYRETHR